MNQRNGWRRCSNCKAEIGFEQKHQVCSISTCNRKRTGLVFCTTSCWDAHVPLMRHRESWAVEQRSPTRADWEREQKAERAAAVPSATTPRPSAPEIRAPRRIIVGEPGAARAPQPEASSEILVVTSKLKKYVRERWEMNTSDAVMELLSDRLRALCDAAIRKARAEGRRTLMKRDF